MNLSDILQTKNVKEQTQRAAQLMARIQNPVINLAVSYDPLSGQTRVQSVGFHSLPAELVIHALAMARDQLLAEVSAARAAQASSSAEPESE